MKKKPRELMTDERRKKARVPENLSVIHCSHQYLLKTNALTRDISEDGICILTPYKIDIGETMELEIYLSETEEAVKAKGTVVRRNGTDDIKLPYLLGIKFTKIDPDAYEKICAHIRFYMLKA
ncbi:MAG: PilZ domain-containing protein [Candidatus Omnitrophota bacterium]